MSWADRNIKTCMKNVSAALALDGQNKARDAYAMYLECVVFATQSLLKDAASQDVCITDRSVRIVKLLQQCISRVDDLVETLHKQGCHGNKSLPSPTSIVDDLPSVPTTLPLSPDASKHPFNSLTDKRRDEQPGSLITATRSGPLAAAHRQNQQLMAAYQARMTQMGKRTNQNATTTLSLNLQRRMAENVALAQAREKALAKKLLERRKRLEEEAARRFSDTMGMSKDEQERRRLYTKVLEYEHQSSFLFSYREKLKADPENLDIIQDLIKLVLSLKDHPLTVLLTSYQYVCYKRIQPLLAKYDSQQSDSTRRRSSQEAQDNLSTTSTPTDFDRTYNIDDFDDLFDKDHEDDFPVDEKDLKSETDLTDVTDIVLQEKDALVRHFQNIVRDIREHMEKMQAFFIVGYKELNSAAGKDLCYAVIEEHYFTAVWPYLLALSRLVNVEREAQLERVIMAKHGRPMLDLNINTKFCLDRSSPYSSAVDELSLLTRSTVPLTKLEHIVKVSRQVCACIDDYYTERTQTVPSIGADDLVPILVYVIIESQLPQLVSECHILEELIHEGYLLGEEGYCLTSLQTALIYLVSQKTEHESQPEDTPQMGQEDTDQSK